MEFGKLENLENVDWRLPPTDPLAADYLRGFLSDNTSPRAEFFVGAPAWGRKEWVGSLYPPKTPASDFLFHYARNFNCVELNTTYYRIPTPEQVKTWTAKVPAQFLFAPKIPQIISHERGGLTNREHLSAWCEALEAFDENLGPCFLQLPPMFSYEHRGLLAKFLKDWPEVFDLALEFRHPSWFEGGRVRSSLVEYLQREQLGLVITDVAGRRDVLHGSVSASYTLVRFIGNDLHPSDFSRLQDWATRLSEWQGHGLKRVFFMVHQPDDIHAPQMSERVIESFNNVCGAQLLPLAKPLL